ncbi:hypothetical protein M406DRAFT_100815 [Cryphonectria parasitica EP155]|uniref:Uncharacterized protein n=1 Tax=Cryphonectria parasitica (strain ATCC 38755 / EP155) TaxID=660469 RepID=A0A9P4YC11_CRYP1|nr:uncharacterized protein M406DRAFT_100815 [Cryphonectria parasitica EP155]KAF3770290.1 hypothetical protein M406DRAFT_100815 [Cryphonectria parasitica EP155]
MYAAFVTPKRRAFCFGRDRVKKSQVGIASMENQELKRHPEKKKKRPQCQTPLPPLKKSQGQFGYGLPHTPQFLGNTTIFVLRCVLVSEGHWYRCSEK